MIDKELAHMAGLIDLGECGVKKHQEEKKMEKKVTEIEGIENAGPSLAARICAYIVIGIAVIAFFCGTFGIKGFISIVMLVTVLGPIVLVLSMRERQPYPTYTKEELGEPSNFPKMQQFNVIESNEYAIMHNACVYDTRSMNISNPAYKIDTNNPQ